MSKPNETAVQKGPPRSRYAPALIDRAVQAVLGAEGSQWAAIEATAKSLGCPAETVRRWVRRAEGARPKKPVKEARAAGKGAGNGSNTTNAAVIDDCPNNARLRELIRASGKTQDEALVIFNRGLKHRPYSTSAWKAFLATPGTIRFRRLSDQMLAHAEAQFAKFKP